jgi:parallel beta-helix repeat protein
MSAKMPLSIFVPALLLLVGTSYGLQNTAADGSVSTFDSRGKLLSITDASGRRTFPGRIATNIANTAPNRAAAAVTPATATTIHVPAEQPTIQAAINAAVDGDTVLVSDGTYVENINFGGKAITVSSVNGPAVTTIDGGKLNTVVLFVTNETSASVLNGFTITNGLAVNQAPNFGEGGGIAIENGASPTITNNIITANGACNGNGIGIGFANPVIQRNSITDNFQTGCSGGIGGGGISIRGDSSGTQVVDNVIANNTMTGSGINGGGLVLFAGGSPLIQNNTISGNTQFGLAMVNASTPRLIQNLIINNTGGGLTYSFGGGTGMALINNTFANNDAQISFVAQFNAASVISGSLPPDVIVQNNLLIAKPGQTAIFCTSALSPNWLANDVFSDGGSAFDAGCGTPPTGTNGNISVDPVLTDVSVGNAHLQPLSPAIDAGNNTTTSILLPITDLDGNPRINNATIDMGALEFQGTTTAAFSTTSLSFAQQLVGTKSAAQQITITNTGSVALQITPSTISSDFTETDDCHTSSGILRGRSCTINVLFAPTARGSRTGQLGVISNDAAGPTTINLSGVGIAPIVTLSAPALTFANQLVSSTSAAQAVTINNIGDAPLTVTSITASGDFAQTNDCGVSVAINASCTINVTFTPTLRGTRNGAVTMADNAAGAPHAVTLQGTGIGPAATLGATSLAFAGQFTGTTSAAQSVTLTSSGETALNITSISATGDFAQTNDCGASLAPTQTCTIQVTFTPTVLGGEAGSIAIVDNSTSTPELVGLSGVGTTFTIGTQPGGTSSATINAGATANYNLTLVGTAGTTGNVTFACSGAPSASTCTVTPGTVGLNGGTPVDFTVAVSTTARGATVPFSLVILPSSGTFWPVLAWSIVALLLMVTFKSTRSRQRAVLASAVLGLFMLMAACGGGGSTPPPPAPTPTPVPTPSPTPAGPGTPAGTSVLAVTATSGNATRTFSLTLTVN